jgi:hypothetical protein
MVIVMAASAPPTSDPNVIRVAARVLTDFNLCFIFSFFIWLLFSVKNANVDLPDTAARDSASKSNNPAVSG